MKLLKILFLAFGLSSVGTFAQDAIEDLPIATIDENYLVSVPEIPVAEAYYVDISHLSFDSEAEANKLINFYLTANLITPEINYDEGYVILAVSLEYIDGEFSHTDFNFYLNHLTKP